MTFVNVGAFTVEEAVRSTPVESNKTSWSRALKEPGTLYQLYR
jgi:hypothetical protein